MFGTYWDPLPAARFLIAKGPDPFDGRWAERNWRNVPGPFYGTETEAGSIGPRDVAEVTYYDGTPGGDFVSRQPDDVWQVQALVADLRLGYRGFAMDGDRHWTPDAVRSWWSERGRVREWALETAEEWSGVTRPEDRDRYLDAAHGLRAYVDHIDGGLEAYLRGYLFWLTEHRVPEVCEPLPVLGRPSGARRSGPRKDELRVAGYLVVEPGLPAVPQSPEDRAELPEDARLPGVERLVSAADCLVDHLPADGCWFPSREAALAACASIRVAPDARLLAMLLPDDCATELAAEIRASAFADPDLLKNLHTPPVPVEGGTRLGWEVLGYELGGLHTWLCSDLHHQAVAELDVRIGPFGLLAERADAERVADWANTRDDTAPVTWFPAALVEWDEPVVGTAAPAAKPSRAPRWRRGRS
ncbi:hypothetical protein KCMC57_up55450 [Kitasatospora sp. CMC57]|uniref:Uncharacterized protein n=1 Tax=Kitasatospora sp. CMC57 TaxID=3231513 RepID=A0AB33K6U3_9ACTN